VCVDVDARVGVCDSPELCFRFSFRKEKRDATRKKSAHALLEIHGTHTRTASEQVGVPRGINVCRICGRREGGGEDFRRARDEVSKWD
jgi:hypothetical protein